MFNCVCLIFQHQINPPLPVSLKQSAKLSLYVGKGKEYEANGGAEGGTQLSWPSLRAKGRPENAVQTCMTSEFAIKSQGDFPKDTCNVQ